MEKDLVRRSEKQVSFVEIPAAGIRGRAPWTVLRNLLVLVRGVRAAGRLLDEFAPDVALATGGYVSIPVGLAAWRKGVPFLLYLPDVVPGLAVRFLARLASRVATTTPASARYIPRGKMVVTGYPVRPAFWQADRRTARRRLGLPEQGPVLLVAGGSRGARSINRAVGAGLADLLPRAVLVHLCGNEEDEGWLRQRAAELSPDLRARYHLYRYLHEMPLAVAAADLAICRAGASVLGELPAAGLPAILVPYPYVHQDENADYLVRHGAAVKVADARLRDAQGQPDPRVLLEAVRRILDDPARYAQMARAARRLACPQAAQAIAEQLQSLAGKEVVP